MAMVLRQKNSIPRLYFTGHKCRLSSGIVPETADSVELAKKYSSYSSARNECRKLRELYGIDFIVQAIPIEDTA